MEQDDDPLIIFRKNIEENMRTRYRDAIRTLEGQIREYDAELRRARR